MRIDHFAYQRAVRVAGVGFLAQLGIGLTLLIFALIARDTAFLFGSVYVLLGLLVWLGLIVVFNQHKLERLEALEEDEFAATRGGAESAFEPADEEIRVAAHRLRLMHKWLMPGLSLIIAAALGIMAWLMLRQMGRVADTEAEFYRTDHIGWAVAICLAFSAVSFIVSRFIAGMAKQPAWLNLRGGAAFMVGNSLVCLAIAVGIGFRFFNRDGVIEAIAWAIPIFAIVLAIEIVANFILNLYRPRVVGETPRPAFDSKLLSMFAAPDNLVKSINEAVNYQFGFDVASSWGYQLLLRSFIRLVVLGVVTFIALNMIVVVEPHEQAVKLRRGEIDGDHVYASGVVWKLPWPLESVEKYPVTTIRTLHLTSSQVAKLDEPHLWTDDLSKKFDKLLDPFIVRSFATHGDNEELNVEAAGGDRTADDADDEDEKRLAKTISLVDAEIVLQYRIREDGGLLDYLRFSSDTVLRREELSVREQALKSLALRQITQFFSRLSFDEALKRSRAVVASDIARLLQRAFDANSTGIEVVAVQLPLLRPAGSAAGGFEELSRSHQTRQKLIAEAEQVVVQGYTQLVGDPANAEPIVAGIEEYERLTDELGAEAPETVARRLEIEQMIVDAGGEGADLIARAERDRWVRQLDAMAQARRLEGQSMPYLAAPMLYRQRETMQVYAEKLLGMRKYVLGVDPARVNFSFDLKELNPLFSIGDAITDEEGESGQ